MAKATGAQNAVIGDNDGPTDLPVSIVKDQALLAEEQEYAKLVTSSDYPFIAKWINDRIAFYQTHLPDGTELRFAELSDEEVRVNWKVATNIINDFKLLLGVFNNAKQAVDQDERRDDA